MADSAARKKEEAARRKAEAQEANKKRAEEAAAKKRAEVEAEQVAIKLGMGSANLKGDRGSQEDRAVARPLSQGERYCGVFDGHLGEGCVEYCMTNLLVHLQQSPHWFAFNDVEALKAAFAETHRRFTTDTSDASGTTATVALIRGRTLHVASAGNSRAVLLSNGKAIPLTHNDDKPEVAPRGLMETVPETAVRELAPQDEFVLLASDGVWECV